MRWAKAARIAARNFLPVPAAGRNQSSVTLSDSRENLLLPQTTRHSPLISLMEVAPPTGPTSSIDLLYLSVSLSTNYCDVRPVMVSIVEVDGGIFCYELTLSMGRLGFVLWEAFSCEPEL